MEQIKEIAEENLLQIGTKSQPTEAVWSHLGPDPSSGIAFPQLEELCPKPEQPQ